MPSGAADVYAIALMVVPQSEHNVSPIATVEGVAN